MTEFDKLKKELRDAKDSCFSSWIDEVSKKIDNYLNNNLYNQNIKQMTKEKQQRNKLIDFILDFASDEIETTNDALKLARMTNQELKEDIKSIKEYYKREHKTII